MMAGYKMGFYLALFKAAIKSRTEYRVDFVVNVVTAITMQLAALGFYWIIFNSTQDLGGWGSGEVLLLFGLTAVAVALTELFFNGIWWTPQYVVSGEMDRLMVYPVRGLLFLMMARPELHALGNLSAGAVMAVMGASRLGLEPAQWALLPLWAGSAMFIYAALLVGLACLTFFTVGVTANPMMVGFHVHNTARYPLHIYPRWLHWFMLVIYPIGVAVYLPVRYLRGEAPLWQVGILPPLVALACMLVALWLWSFSLKHYQSTGS